MSTTEFADFLSINEAVVLLEDWQQIILNESTDIEGEALNLRRAHLLHGTPSMWGKTYAARLTFKDNERRHTIRKHIEQSRERLGTLWGARNDASQALVKLEKSMEEMSGACRAIKALCNRHNLPEGPHVEPQNPSVVDTKARVQDLLVDEADTLRTFQLWKPYIEVLCVTDLYKTAVDAIGTGQVSQHTLQADSEILFIRFMTLVTERKNALDELASIARDVLTSWSQTEPSQVAKEEVESILQKFRGLRARINATKSAQDEVSCALDVAKKFKNNLTFNRTRSPL
ncbi:hypothetical protein C8Q76DRAFT_695115 [Earliella scabrosa]|nr:hypothetical protein C8Q76DRAFT_695115 [Earliella scabrosa]